MKPRKYVFAACCLSVMICTPIVQADDNYTLIVEKNLFSPQRKKWESPPKIAPKKQVAKAMLPVLKGTVITKNRRRAVLAFGKPAYQPPPPPSSPARHVRGRKKAPAPPPPVRQATVRTGNSRILSVGDSINDFRLVAVEHKQVTLEYEGEKITLFQQ